MVWRLRFIGRWVGVVLGTLAWLLVVPVLELGRALPRRLSASARERRGFTVAGSSRAQGSPARS